MAYYRRRYRRYRRRYYRRRKAKNSKYYNRIKTKIDSLTWLCFPIQKGKARFNDPTTGQSWEYRSLEAYVTQSTNYPSYKQMFAKFKITGVSIALAPSRFKATNIQPTPFLVCLWKGDQVQITNKTYAEHVENPNQVISNKTGLSRQYFKIGARSMNTVMDDENNGNAGYITVKAATELTEAEADEFQCKVSVYVTFFNANT